ncbi:MAG: AMP-binding protein [Gammaproteobacteria bacterium]|nr:AMP-binding protein [Gammaproteobacteria bacterium]
MFHNKQRIPMHAAQTTMFSLEKLRPETINNHRSVTVEITGLIDKDKFLNATKALIKRHEILRSCVHKQSNAELEITSYEEWITNNKPPLQLLDVSKQKNWPTVENLYPALKKIKKESFIEKPFNLYEGPLWRWMLIKTAENSYQFVMMYHHIIVDETAIGIIFKDLSAFYNGSEATLTPLPSHPYQDLSLNANEIETRLNYWKGKLEKLTPIELQTDVPLSKQKFNFEGKRIPFELDKDLVKKLVTHPQMKGFSFNQICTAVLYFVLIAYSDSEAAKLCIGITSANRRHAKVSDDIIQGLVNCFFNSIPLCVDSSAHITFIQFLAQVKLTLTEALKNQLPLDVVFQQALSTKTKSTLPIASPFNIALVLNTKKPTLTLNQTIATHPRELDLGRCKFSHFGMNLDEQYDGSYTGFVEYNTDLFNEISMQYFIKHFLQAMQSVCENPSLTAADISLLLPEEKELLIKYNQTEKQTPSNQSIPNFFHEQALHYPEAIFAVFHTPENREKITYEQLDEASSRLENYLISIGTQPGSSIGISIERSMNLLVTFMAVLKAGCVAVPLETEDNIKLHYKIKKSALSHILTDKKTSAIFNDSSAVIVNIEDAKISAAIQACSATYTALDLTALNAYVMYTSGTEGLPKGVISSHTGLTNLLYALMDQKLKPETQVLCTALPTFDAWIFDLLVAMLTHGAIHFCPENLRFSPEMLHQMIISEKINCGAFITEVLSKLDLDLIAEYFYYVISMGSSAHEEILRLLKEKNPDCQVINGCGRTESGICDSLRPYEIGDKPTYVGFPIANMQMYVLNPRTFALCPFNVPGEVFAAGPGVATAYVDDPILTAEKFLWMKFDDKENKFIPCEANSPSAMKLYKTGDRGCYRRTETGNPELELMGRKDSQIKIYGVRVELKAMEALLRNHATLIKEVALLFNEEKQMIIAYIVPVKEMPERELRKEVRSYLATTFLPPVARPRKYCILPELNLTVNGKIDLRALPDPEKFTNSNINNPPISALESKLQEIWAEVLNCSKQDIDIEDTFEELGGHSLLYVALELNINSKLSLPCYVRMSIFSKTMTISDIASKLESLMEPTFSPPSSLVPLPSDFSLQGNKSVMYQPAQPAQVIHADYQPSVPVKKN